ncbi:serine/threonine-protein kinase [Nannocystis pusilla]|uniref:serine/threonine-protein kinase n=1 Tax=Nannocystis pusilla TaxID=889268 RepID=UPI003B7726E7
MIRRLGKGGMGTVYSAHDTMLGRVVALKTLRPDRNDSGTVGRFIREGRALARLSHPNIVSIFDMHLADGQVVLVMEYVRGRTLKRHLAQQRQGERLPAILGLFMQAAGGLHAAHCAGLVHRDVKPDNLMLGDDGRVRVMDFGLAQFAARPPGARRRGAVDVDGLAPELTAVGAVLGTPSYMAPEQHAGDRVDARTDVFGFCASLYEALYGERPFAARGYDDLRRAKLAGEVRLPPHPHVPEQLREVVLRGLRVAPGERWPDMATLMAELARFSTPARRARGGWAA